MAPTEYRVIAKRSQPRPIPGLRGLVAAGEALDPDILGAWREATGLEIRDGYGQTETGQTTGNPVGEPAARGRWDARCRACGCGWRTASSCSTPPPCPRSSGTTWARRHRPGTWHTGDRVRQDEDGYLYFEGRSDDVIISAGYRIGPFEVESALVEHPAVAEAAVVAHPDEERGSVVRAVVVLRDGYAAGDDLAREIQDHVKRSTAPYKYPRVVDFATELPRTASGKVRRAALR